MNVVGKLFVIHKHWLGRNGKRKRRFYKPEDISEARDNALNYSDENDEDYLIVSIVEEVSRPTKRAADECPGSSDGKHEFYQGSTWRICAHCGTRR